MKISNLKINGISNPVGYSFEKVVVSCTAEDTEAKKLVHARIEVSTDPDFSTLCCVREGENIRLAGEAVKLQMEPRTRYYVRTAVSGDNGETAVSETGFFETAKMEENWCGKWIGTESGDDFHPVFSVRFQAFDTNRTAAAVQRARLYICGLGVYEAYLNGQRIGEDYLAPFLTDYNSEVQYQTYPVESLLQEENELSVYLGNGWYKGRFGLDQHDHNFGDHFALLAELHLDYTDGTSQVIASGDHWSYQGSDVEESSIYDGEVYNRLLWEDRANPKKPACVLRQEEHTLAERFSIPVIVKETLSPAAVLHTPAGETVLDMGQNFTGYLEFKAVLPKGTRITLEFGEVLQQGNFYHDNYRTAKSRFEYVANGEEETVRPHFTFFGFRYARITGWPGEVPAGAFTGCVVYSDLTRTGYLETGHAKINRLYENCVWGQKSNFLDVPTDCPQRDERLGWTGDSQVFAPTASYNMDTRAFYRKHLRDLRDAQVKKDGAVPYYVPEFGNMTGSCSVWGDVAAFVPNTLYKAFGNLEEMELYYPLMKDWVDYITRLDEQNGTHHLYDTGFHFGDWLAQDGITPQSVKGGTDDYFIASVYYCQSARLTAEMAERLERKEEAGRYRKLQNEIRAAILQEYFTQTGRLAVDTQAAYIISLKFEIYPDKEKVLSQFRQRLLKDSYKIKCGFVGAPLLCLVLCENGMQELAYDFLFQEEFPSWLYSVNLGATTIWERWNSLLSDGTVSGTGMNSLNHYSYGSVVEFLYAYAAGIRSAENGYHRAVLAPEPDIRLRRLCCRYDSVNGTYRSEWKIRENGELWLRFEVPFDCEAAVRLPEYPALENPCGLKLTEDGGTVLESGTYEFEYMPKKDYRKPYHLDTRLGKLGQDEKVVKLLRSKLPYAVPLVTGEDAEGALSPLRSLTEGGFGRLVQESAKEVVEEILNLKADLE